MRLDLLASFNAERAARRACVVVTALGSGDQRLVRAAEVADDPLAPALRAALASGRSGVVGEGAERAFLTVEIPAPRLLVIGAVHISQALAPMAAIAGFDTTILDPRTAFATAERFPEVPVIAEWPDVALPAYGLDPFTAMVALTHDPKIDDPALVEALKAGCFYIGALGSRRTHAKRLDRLAAQGFDAQTLARLHAPIGLDIGAASPPEIAVAVLAEVIQALRKPRPSQAAEAAA
ncbi:XdhC family protein [Xanthobacter sp. ZOL 2024]